MFILLAILLSFLALALNVSASSLELANKVYNRKVKVKDDELNNSVRLAKDTAIGVTVTGLRFLASVVSVTRSLILFVGGFVFILDLIILIIVVVSSVGMLTLF